MNLHTLPTRETMAIYIVVHLVFFVEEWISSFLQHTFTVLGTAVVVYTAWNKVGTSTCAHGACILAGGDWGEEQG